MVITFSAVSASSIVVVVVVVVVVDSRNSKVDHLCSTAAAVDTIG